MSKFSQKIRAASIIITWNNYNLTRVCAASFVKAVSPDHEVIVVDNHSTDGSTQKIQKEFSQFTYIYNSDNLGISKANNVAMRYALDKGAEFVFLFNNDIELIDKNSLHKMIKYVENCPGVGILGPRLIYPDGRQQPCVKPFPTLWNQFYFQWFIFRKLLHFFSFPEKVFDYHRIQDVDFVMGAAILVRRKMIEEIGLQDESFFCGGEDLDLCKRAHNAGWKVRYFPDVTIMHVHGASTRHLLGNRFNFDYYYRERLRYFKKYYNPFTVFLFRILVSLGAVPRVLFGWFRLVFMKTDFNKAYAREYSRLFYRIWLYSWFRENKSLIRYVPKDEMDL